MDADSINRKVRRQHAIESTWRYVLLIITAFIMIYPIIWLFGASFKTNAEIFGSINFWPQHFDWTSYVKGWKTGTQYSFTTYFINSFKIVIPKVIFTLISCTLTAYAFTRFDFPGKNILFSIVIATLFLPAVVTRIPLYIMWRNLHLLDSYVPLIAGSVFAQEPFFVFMLVQFMRGIPKEYDEAAVMDGANPLQILGRVLVPMMKPALLTVVLFQFIWSMNDFLTPLIYLSSVSKFPVAIALKLATDATSGFVPWNQTIAMSLIALVPSLILFFSASRNFVEGMSAGGLKG
ncbi:carbohydrate ABC transporter permease [Lapidilactobacillus bayanensis]|uniref:carbohydrate ABC transporter permease n=1 Tax=Lapidilactobacillus bayanensis TaxID=2485998 RepID=UPI000F7AF013|nr:carbohydrate ABC transporter permease [Lapidilactobacillus bayanensis]